MRSLHHWAMAARRTNAAPDKPDFVPDLEPLPPIRLGAWAGWMAAREGGAGPADASAPAQRARVGSLRQPQLERNATD